MIMCHVVIDYAVGSEDAVTKDVVDVDPKQNVNSITEKETSE